MPLSEPLRTALENLHKKKSGLVVEWINIADARELTELGLATRSHQGWTITDAGQEILSSQPERGTAATILAGTWSSVDRTPDLEQDD
jgi:hypothetical protein